MNKILEGSKFVVENSTLVKINKDRVHDFAKTLSHGKATHWLSAAPFDFLHLSQDEKLHFLFVFNALSFSYWGVPKWAIESEGKQLDGSWGMIAALGKAIKRGVPLLDFEFSSNISKNDFADILAGNIVIPLFDERLEALHEVGKVAMNKYQGKLKNLLSEASGDAQKLLEIILLNFPSFQDSSRYNGVQVYFQKRAQLLVADIYQMFQGHEFGALQNIHQITACADYKLPQILRKLGILEYAPTLADRIDSKTEIIHDSEEEVEIRASTIWAVELIKEEVKKHNPGILSFEINDHLWLATQEKYSDDKPYHRTRTTAY